MKAYTILILIAASLGVSVLLYADKSKKITDIDRFAKTLQPAAAYIPANTTIVVVTEPGKSELLPWARYTLVPRYLSPNGDNDTTLIIQYRQNGDSTLNAIITSQELLWQSQNDEYIFSLTRKR